MNSENPGCLGWLLRLCGIGKPDAPAASADSEAPASYRVREDFLSAAESSFCQVLRRVVGQQYLICPKVSLRDLFYVSPAKGNQGARNRLASKHIDFLLIEPTTLKPVAGLELDDASHQRSDVAERDRYKDQVFASAGLPLIRIPVQHAYQVEQVATLVLGALGPAPDTVPCAAEAEPAAQSAEVPASNGSPLCPKCGVEMTRRTAKRGEQANREFWGCTDYPKCRGILPIPSTPMSEVP